MSATQIDPLKELMAERDDALRWLGQARWALRDWREGREMTRGQKMTLQDIEEFLRRMS